MACLSHHIQINKDFPITSTWERVHNRRLRMEKERGSRMASPLGFYGFERLFYDNLLAIVDVDAGTSGLCHAYTVD